jgi:hypothetical protein
MKASEFKKILKPLIEQTVKEVLLQEGVLSKVVSEVAQGLQAPLVEAKNTSKPPTRDTSKEAEEYEARRQERIRKLNESAGLGEVFNQSQVIPESNSKGPLSGIGAQDSGVDISGILKVANGKWKQLAGNE